MTAIPTFEQALAAAVAVAGRLGCTQAPEIVADGYSLRVRVGPLLTRVITAGQRLRGPARPWLERELALAGWLDAQNAAVVAPWSDAGPHEAEGCLVTVWRWVDGKAGCDQTRYGRLLATLHRQLRDCPLQLPLLSGPLADITTALAQSDDAQLHGAAADLLPRVYDWPRQVLHGDAHLGNVLQTSDGLRWMDFEDACVGPVEWDLASSRNGPAVLEAYGEPVDEMRLLHCRALRRLQQLASGLLDTLTPADDLKEAREDLHSRLKIILGYGPA